MTGPPVDQRKLARAVKLVVDKGYTLERAGKAAGVTKSAVWRAMSKRPPAPVAPDPVKLNWELWRRELEPERTPGTKQFIRKFYLIERFATRALINKRVEEELYTTRRLYIPSDLHIANVVAGIPRPPFKSIAPNQTPRLPLMPWDTVHRKATREEVALKKRLKAAQHTPPKPLRTMVVDDTVVEIPRRVIRITDSYGCGWHFRIIKGRKLAVTKYFPDRRYGGAVAALSACKRYIETLK